MKPSAREDLKAWSPVTWAHRDSSFGFTGYLPQKDFNAWDRERMSNPERTWPADGAVSELYDSRRKGKPSWRPTTSQKSGRSFPLEAPPLPGQRHLQNPLSNWKRPSLGVPGPLDTEIPRSRSHGSVAATAATAATCTPRSQASASASASASCASLASSRRPSKTRLMAQERRMSEPGGGKVWSTFGEILEGL